MFDVRKRGPHRRFVHVDGCRIVRLDPDVEIPWVELERGHWQATCQCGAEHYHEDAVDRRARLDPLDPSTFRHIPGCEYANRTDPVLVQAILTVQEGAGGTYWWVTCRAGCRWQVPYYASEST